MFAYALIAAELLLFSLVFYLVFIREPKKFEVKENLWGYYGKQSEEPNYMKPFMSSIENNLAFPKAKQRNQKRHRLNNQINRMMKRTRHGVKGLPSRSESEELKNGWNYVAEEKSSRNIGNFLSFMGQLLTNLSAKFS